MGFREEIIGVFGQECRFNEPMKNHTSFGLGGNTEYYCLPQSPKTLVLICDLAKTYKIPCRIIGNGSNLLVSDKGFNGLIVGTSKLKHVLFENNYVRTACGTTLNELINECKTMNLSGIERLYGIPATVGGAICMNASAYGTAISDCIKKVYTVKNGMLKTYGKDECEFGYRKSIFQRKKEIIISAVFQLKTESGEVISKTVSEVLAKRRNLQPSGRSCGSVFLNGTDYKAAELIEKAGLKGAKKGGAAVSEKHSNFIVVDKNASSQDVYSLIKTVKEKVKKTFDITLAEEVEYLGEF